MKSVRFIPAPAGNILRGSLQKFEGDVVEIYKFISNILCNSVSFRRISAPLPAA